MEDNKINWRLVITIIASMLIVLIVLQLANQNTNQDIVNDKNMIASTNLTGEDTVINITIADENKYFKDWFSTSYMSIYNDITCISDATKNQDFDSIAACGDILRQDSNMYLIQIDELTVSDATLQTVLDKYKKSLIDYNTGGSMLKAGAINRNATQMSNAGAHIQNGNARIDDIVGILRITGN